MLADRIVMLEHGKVSADIPVPLPRPREQGSAFAALEGEVLRRILRREPVESALNRQQPVRLVGDDLAERMTTKSDLNVLTTDIR